MLLMMACAPYACQGGDAPAFLALGPSRTRIDMLKTRAPELADGGMGGH